MSEWEKIAKEIKDMLDARGMTQKDMASELGIPPAAVYSHIGERQQPLANNCIKYMRYLARLKKQQAKSRA